MCLFAKKPPLVAAVIQYLLQCIYDFVFSILLSLLPALVLVLHHVSGALTDRRDQRAAAASRQTTRRRICRCLFVIFIVVLAVRLH